MEEGEPPKAKHFLILLLAASGPLLLAAAVALTNPSQTTQHRLQPLTYNNTPAVATYTAGTNHTLCFRDGVPMSSQRLGKALVWLDSKTRLPLFKNLMVFGYHPPKPALCVYVCSKNGATLPQFDVSLVSPPGLPTLCNHFSLLGASRVYMFPVLPSNPASFSVVIEDGANQLTKSNVEK
jgi:hypothetical protein